MLGLFVMGLIGVLGLVFGVVLVLVLARFLMALLPITLVGIFLWAGLRWVLGFIEFLVMGVVTVFQALWHLLF